MAGVAEKSTAPSLRKAGGFTIIEVLVTISIALVLFGLISINLGKSSSAVSVSGVVNTLLADIKHQQLLAMGGDQGSTSSQQSQGIYLQADSYTLFAGNSYSGGDSNNFTVDLPSSVTLTTSFAGNTVLFTKGAGEVNSFVGGNNTITISDPSTSQTITIGRLGALTVN